MPGGAGLCALLVAWLGCGESGDFSGSPADSLPPHIQQLTDWGARPGWSHDGRHTTVERNPRNFLLPGMVEIWKLVLDGSGS